jgi:anti-sigma factor RsiW
MNRAETKISSICPSPELAAYIDGELSPHGELELEMHVAVCRTCARELNLQKSFLNALDSSLEIETEIELPKNFAKTVVANAESRVSGLRHPNELRNAALICGSLMIFSLFALGGSSGRSLTAVVGVFDKLVAVVVSVAHVLYDVALGSSIVVRSLGSNFLFGSAGPALAFVALFALSLYLFSRLLRLRRT